MSIPWGKLEHFGRHEFDDPLHPGSGDKIDGTLLALFVRMRYDIGYPIITHHGVGGCVDIDGSHGHGVNSYHLLKQGCKAVDFHIRTNELTAREKCYYVLNSGFTGVGIYYWWRWNGEPLDVGFHVDIRPKDRIQYWTSSKRGEYTYFLK